MTSRVIRQAPGEPNPGQVKEITISCDQIDCTASVNDEAISRGGGLKKMGWQAAFLDHKMRHYCPVHRRTKE